MILRAYSVKDSALKAFLSPFFCRTDAEANRSFVQACAQGSLKHNAQDYELYHIGEFDDTSGMLVYGPIKFLSNGHQALNLYAEMIKANRPRTTIDPDDPNNESRN